jgi:hypothetical protein
MYFKPRDMVTWNMDSALYPEIIIGYEARYGTGPFRVLEAVNQGREFHKIFGLQLVKLDLGKGVTEWLYSNEIQLAA